MIRYRPLFDVDIAHDYFLSRGDVVLEAQADVDRAAIANLYSVGNFLEVFPDDATKAPCGSIRRRTTPGRWFHRPTISN